MDYQFIRSGENIYDDQGTLLKNVGGDLKISHGPDPEDENAYFLDGIRFNNNIFQLGLRIEPIRDFVFDIIYNYDQQKNLTEGSVIKQNYGLLKFTLNY